MKKSVASLMDEIRKNLELLESSLPKRVDGSRMDHAGNDQSTANGCSSG